MIFKAPAPAQYFISLIIAAILGAVAYFGLQNQSFASGSFMLALGVFLGHLAGVFAAPSTAGAQAAPSSRANKPAGNSSETISLYVGNLAYNAQRNAVQELFARHGEVKSLRIMTDRVTRRPRGYCFVEMDVAGARKAIRELDNTEFCGRTLKVSEAKQRPE